MQKASRGEFKTKRGDERGQEEEIFGTS